MTEENPVTVGFGIFVPLVQITNYRIRVAVTGGGRRSLPNSKKQSGSLATTAGNEAAPKESNKP